jgi:hypothetical protein
MKQTLASLAQGHNGTLKASRMMMMMMMMMD